MWAWRPPGCGPGDPPGQTPQLSPGCGPGDPPKARPLNFPPGCGPGDLQGMLGYHPPPGDLQGMLGQGGHGTGKTGNLVLFPDRENTGNFALTQGKILRHRDNIFCDTGKNLDIENI